MLNNHFCIYQKKWKLCQLKRKAENNKFRVETWEIKLEIAWTCTRASLAALVCQNTHENGPSARNHTVWCNAVDILCLCPHRDLQWQIESPEWAQRSTTVDLNSICISDFRLLQVCSNTWIWKKSAIWGWTKIAFETNKISCCLLEMSLFTFTSLVAVYKPFLLAYGS